MTDFFLRLAEAVVIAAFSFIGGMTQLQAAFAIYIAGVVCGGFMAYIVRPWDFDGERAK